MNEAAAAAARSSTHVHWTHWFALVCFGMPHITTIHCNLREIGSGLYDIYALVHNFLCTFMLLMYVLYWLHTFIFLIHLEMGHFVVTSKVNVALRAGLCRFHNHSLDNIQRTVALLVQITSAITIYNGVYRTSTNFFISMFNCAHTNPAYPMPTEQQRGPQEGLQEGCRARWAEAQTYWDICSA